MKFHELTTYQQRLCKAAETYENKRFSVDADWEVYEFKQNRFNVRVSNKDRFSWVVEDHISHYRVRGSESSARWRTIN